MWRICWRITRASIRGDRHRVTGRPGHDPWTRHRDRPAGSGPVRRGLRRRPVPPDLLRRRHHHDRARMAGRARLLPGDDAPHRLRDLGRRLPVRRGRGARERCRGRAARSTSRRDGSAAQRRWRSPRPGARSDPRQFTTFLWPAIRSNQTDRGRTPSFLGEVSTIRWHGFVRHQLAHDKVHRDVDQFSRSRRAERAACMIRPGVSRIDAGRVRGNHRQGRAALPWV